MNEKINDLFIHSSFYFKNKHDPLNDLENSDFDRVEISSNLIGAHPNRIYEFKLGRLAAHIAAKKLGDYNLLNLQIDKSRKPLWPNDLCGSISHNKNWVGAAVALNDKVLGIGIDIEEFGRVKPELAKMIAVEQDIRSHIGISNEELLTIIFSAKESLFKAIYPLVNKYFGFEYAALTHLDLSKCEFEISLLRDLIDRNGLNYRGHYKGKIKIVDSTCVTVIEYIK